MEVLETHGLKVQTTTLIGISLHFTKSTPYLVSQPTYHVRTMVTCFYNFADFIKYKSECDPEASAIRLSGILSLHLLSGRGLRTGGRSRRIRDLYCVVEVDHIHKARTVVRSGGVNFDWDEK